MDKYYSCTDEDTRMEYVIQYLGNKQVNNEIDNLSDLAQNTRKFRWIRINFKDGRKLWKILMHQESEDGQLDNDYSSFNSTVELSSKEVNAINLITVYSPQFPENAAHTVCPSAYAYSEQLCQVKAGQPSRHCDKIVGCFSYVIVTPPSQNDSAKIQRCQIGSIAIIKCESACNEGAKFDMKTGPCVPSTEMTELLKFFQTIQWGTCGKPMGFMNVVQNTSTHGRQIVPALSVMKVLHDNDATLHETDVRHACTIIEIFMQHNLKKMDIDLGKNRTYKNKSVAFTKALLFWASLMRLASGSKYAPDIAAVVLNNWLTTDVLFTATDNWTGLTDCDRTTGEAVAKLLSHGFATLRFENGGDCEDGALSDILLITALKNTLEKITLEKNKHTTKQMDMVFERLKKIKLGIMALSCKDQHRFIPEDKEEGDNTVPVMIDNEGFVTSRSYHAIAAVMVYPGTKHVKLITNESTASMTQPDTMEDDGLCPQTTRKKPAWYYSMDNAVDYLNLDRVVVGKQAQEDMYLTPQQLFLLEPALIGGSGLSRYVWSCYQPRGEEMQSPKQYKEYFTKVMNEPRTYFNTMLPLSSLEISNLYEISKDCVIPSPLHAHAENHGSMQCSRLQTSKMHGSTDIKCMDVFIENLNDGYQVYALQSSPSAKTIQTWTAKRYTSTEYKIELYHHFLCHSNTDGNCTMLVCFAKPRKHEKE